MISKQSLTQTLNLETYSYGIIGLPRWLSSKEYACSAGSIPGSGRSPGGGHPLQYCCLDNPMDRGAWRATVYRVAESDMTEAT